MALAKNANVLLEGVQQMELKLEAHMDGATSGRRNRERRHKQPFVRTIVFLQWRLALGL